MFFYNEVKRVISKTGTLGIIQNSRIWQNLEFLNEYASILEKTSPGCSRDYRNFDIESELASANFQITTYILFFWNRKLNYNQLTDFFKSSSKVKAGIENIGKKKMMKLINDLIIKHFTTTNAVYDIPYESQLFVCS